VIGTVAGAFVGTTLRYATIAAWQGPVPLFISTLVATGAAFAVLGLILTDIMRPAVRAAVCGFVGSAASFSVLALVTISATPVGCVAYLLGAPIAGICGLVVGILVGVTLQRRTRPLVA
jgi:hypothetical protein